MEEINKEWVIAIKELIAQLENDKSEKDKIIVDYCGIPQPRRFYSQSRFVSYTNPNKLTEEEFKKARQEIASRRKETVLT